MKDRWEILGAYEFNSLIAIHWNSQANPHKHNAPKYWPPALVIRFHRSEVEIGSFFPGHLVAFCWLYVRESWASNKNHCKSLWGLVPVAWKQVRAGPREHVLCWHMTCLTCTAPWATGGCGSAKIHQVQQASHPIKSCQLLVALFVVFKAQVSYFPCC